MPIIALIGPSAAGKSTLVDAYAAEYPRAILHKSITTRPSRGPDDTSHIFVTDAEFDALERQGNLIQVVTAYGVRYGLTTLPDSTAMVVFVMIRQQFANEFKRYYPDAHIVQVEADTETLVKRLSARGDTHRINKLALLTETENGRQKAEAVIINDGPLARSYKEFSVLCNKFL